VSSDQGQTQVWRYRRIGRLPRWEGARAAFPKKINVRRSITHPWQHARKMIVAKRWTPPLTDSTFMAKTDGDLKNLSGADLIQEMMNNPLTQAKSGTAWAQVNIAKAGLGKEMG
jgi:hypothetical protein